MRHFGGLNEYLFITRSHDTEGTEGQVIFVYHDSSSSVHALTQDSKVKRIHGV